MTTIARSPEDLTSAWFTGMLRGAKRITDSTVETVEIAVVGTGQLGSLLRATLSYDRAEPGAPDSVIVKLASTDDGSREMGIRTGAYEAEVRFYQQIAPTIQMGLPHCEYAAFDAQHGWTTVVMTDLSDRTEPGDVLQGSSVDQASAALQELVGLQAPRWNDPRLATEPWLDHSRTVALFDEVPGQAQAILARFGDKLEPEHVTLIERVAPLAPKWVRSWGTPRVVQHGDYRLDNMLLATHPGAPRIIVVDWQTVRLGPPTIDASYYLGVSLSVEQRRHHEKDLMADYHRSLIAAGVRDWSWDDCWLEYRTQSIYGLYMALAFGAQVKQTERGDAMFAMATRVYADLALDHDAAKLLEQQL
ncbi:ecdysteroid 22-kinase family protein [[Mycobacterium] zoologicum]|uniref:ecdysteroid 22-kinase family protein n=1 Tax=[Mycobacterium] zoologicum TaxID=2872311 RepID=UPI001CDA5689|nr:ecdysteroid 22-kinase family protein [Mycolicibacter sp. MYC101]MEB3061938.1 phosphotransferase [Mycolicibacter sp. MYC101]